ncbi:synapse differentiation-inducing gene protein 1-like [Poecilia latipinna]|uniref:synapse differentiation-inducing gene protein 1-like n=1 Tax=Poecilia latipinna TaxID=48699 RepID=UPI00072DA2CA|nr:PREDICTED: synapse differentiation-inducing gene protein 1-like [Poecilia latipinna]
MGQPQPGQPGVFIVQPILQNHQAGPINDYFCYSIFTMLFCCLPLGIAALVSSIATRNAIARRDWQMAVQSSRRALMLNHIALGMGISVIAIINVVIVIMYII